MILTRTWNHSNWGIEYVAKQWCRECCINLHLEDCESSHLLAGNNCDKCFRACSINSHIYFQAYPCRGRKNDWDKLEAEVKREEKEEKPEGDQALQKLFSDIYSSSDEDTRRAMNKSFQARPLSPAEYKIVHTMATTGTYASSAAATCFPLHMMWAVCHKAHVHNIICSVLPGVGAHDRLAC